MAKRKPRAIKAPQPVQASKAYNGPSFDELEDEILDWINTLQSVSKALDQSEGCGGCEIGARATNAVRLCAKNLYRLATQLEGAVRHDQA
jgi:hypothetical protein